MNNIEIYTSPTCTYCQKAKKLLKMLNLEYSEHDVSDSFEKMISDMKDRFGVNVQTIPQIVINGNYIGGYDDLEAAYKSGKLNGILK